MWYLLILYIVALVGIALRFVITGQFEWSQFGTCSLFLLGALIIGAAQRWQAKRDLTYKPEQTDLEWNTYLSERYSAEKKMLYKGAEKTAEYRRFYRKWRHRLVDEIFAGHGKWFMNLSFEWTNGERFAFVEQKGSIFRVNDTWHVVHNEQVIAKVKTDYTIKNAIRLQEGIHLEINGKTYYFKSSTISSKTDVFLDEERVASGMRSHIMRFQYRFDTAKGNEEIEPLLVMTYILFSYVHRQ
ncbi:hypothetical protein [Brevibacillus borstelensis]|uniref:hypothetical protein n=1 Tax=Brevibacillus borstelensis TaxID=45462 RepID=UPI0030BCF340